MAANEDSKVLRIVLIVFAVLAGTAAVCCTGLWFAGERVAEEVKQAVGPVTAGSGVAAVQERLVDDFQAIRAEGLIDIDVTIGETTSVTLQADDNVLPLLTTEVVGGTLVFASRGAYSAETAVRATVVVPVLTGVTAEGLGDIVVRGIDEPSFDVVVSGLGSVSVEGATDALEVEVQGNGDAHLARLVARTVRVRVLGIGDAEVHATESLDATVRGMGDVVYSGDPAEVSQDVEGMGTVRPAE